MPVLKTLWYLLALKKNKATLPVASACTVQPCLQPLCLCCCPARGFNSCFGPLNHPLSLSSAATLWSLPPTPPPHYSHITPFMYCAYSIIMNQKYLCLLAACLSLVGCICSIWEWHSQPRIVKLRVWMLVEWRVLTTWYSSFIYTPPPPGRMWIGEQGNVISVMDASQALSNCCIKLQQMSYFVQKFFPGPASSVRNVRLALCCSPGPVPVVSPKISTRQGYLRGICALEVSNTV